MALLSLVLHLHLLVLAMCLALEFLSKFMYLLKFLLLMIMVSFYFICLHILFEKENANFRILHQELISPHLNFVCAVSLVVSL